MICDKLLLIIRRRNPIFQMNNRLITSLTVIISLFMSNEAYNFTAFEEPTGAFVQKTFDIYISHDKWKLLYYFDLNTFFENIDIYKDCLSHMEFVCHSMPQREQCKLLVEEHRKMMDHLNLDAEYVKIIQSKENKRKRDAALGFIGTYILKPTIGTMDEEDAIEICGKINKLAKNQRIHTLMLEKSMSIIKQEIILTNATFERFRDTVIKLQSYLNNLTSSVNTVENEMKSHLNFKYLSSTASLLLIEHQKTIRSIKHTLKNTLFGDFTELIPYKQFLKDLREVTHTLNDVSFMIIDSLPELQKTITIQGTAYDKRLLIEIAVPIIHRNLYKIYTIIPLPLRL